MYHQILSSLSKDVGDISKIPSWVGEAQEAMLLLCSSKEDNKYPYLN